MNTNDMLQHLFDEHRTKVESELDELTLYDEHEELKSAIERITEYLHGMEALLMTRKNLGIEDSMYLPKEEEKPQLYKTYGFERKLRGGVIRVNGEDYYIPEQMVQDMAIDHGDDIRVLDETQLPNGKVRYALEVDRRFGNKHPHRRMLTGTTFLDGDTLRVHDPETDLDVRITHKDETRFQLGDQEKVTLAYYTNNTEVSAVFSKEGADDLFRLLYVMPEGTHYMERCQDIPPYFEKATRYHGTENTLTTSSLERQHNILVIFDNGDRLHLPAQIQELAQSFSESGKPVFMSRLGEFPEPKHIRAQFRVSGGIS